PRGEGRRPARTGRDPRHRAGAHRRHRHAGRGRGARPEGGLAGDRSREVDVGDDRTMISSALLTIFAAASLTNVFPQIDKKPRYSFAGSNALAAQIKQGAPADVFASANTSIPQQLYDAGLVEKPVVFTRNALILIVPKSNPARIHSVYDLRRDGVKLVVAAPGVPVGDYTRVVLHNLNLDDALGNVVSNESDVREVLAKVALGEADAGFVYTTDAR